MDAYTHVLDQLRKDDCRRLRNYAIEPESKFTTWLVVVARRACIDFHRVRYGRVRAADSLGTKDRRQLRRKLQELTAIPEDLASVVDEAAETADRMVLDEELTTSLQGALDTLIPSDRLILALRFEEDLSASEIAKILMMPSPFHVYRRLNGILSRLRAILRERGFESTLT
jgi:RNA polymerase sigma factor (sigma-70 family)